VREISIAEQPPINRPKGSSAAYFGSVSNLERAPLETEIAGLRSGDAAAFSITGESEEQVVALIQCRTSDAARRQALTSEAAGLIRARHGLEALVALVPPHSLPQTSSGKLSRSKAKSLYLSGGFEAAAVRVTA